MARQIPAGRFEALVKGATEVFIARGYRMTQMAEVAAAIGVAKGTLYGYVESKDALLVLCLAWADREDPIPVPEALPLPSLPPGELGARVKEALEMEVQQPRLAAAIESASVADALQEAHEVIGELYDLQFSNRHRIKLLDRCMDHPELADLWQTHGREGVRMALARYLEHRAASGHFLAFENVRLAARIVLETCATWAVHIHWDRSPEAFSEEESRRMVIDSLVRGLLV